MAAIDTLAVRDAAVHQLLKRSNWAGKNAGVVVVFAIVFVVFTSLIGLFITKKLKARKDRKTSNV